MSGRTGSKLVGSVGAGFASSGQLRRLRCPCSQNRRPIARPGDGRWRSPGTGAFRCLPRAHRSRRRHRSVWRNKFGCNRFRSVRAGDGRRGCDRRGARVHRRKRPTRRLHDPNIRPHARWTRRSSGAGILRQHVDRTSAQRVLLRLRRHDHRRSDHPSAGIRLGRRARIDLDPRSHPASAQWRAAARRRWAVEQSARPT